MTNTSNLVSQLEPSAPKDIMVKSKNANWCLSFGGGKLSNFYSIKHIPGKSNMKSPAISPPRKDPIPNQDNNILITKQDPSLPPNIERYPP